MFGKRTIFNFGLALFSGVTIVGLMIWIALESSTSSELENTNLSEHSSKVYHLEADEESLLQKVSVDSILTDEAGICLLSLNREARNSLSITGNSSLTALGCDIHNNSGAASGLTITTNAKVRANSISTSGGFNGGVDNFTPHPRTGRPIMDDPLSNLERPNSTSCDKRNFVLRPGKNQLDPGVYCGGIVALSASDIELKPGIYIIKNGPLIIGNRSTLSGVNVGFYFTGNNSEFSFGVSTKIDLTAPIEGEMAGVLFYEDRETRVSRDFVLRSQKIEKLEGAIYLPKSRLVFDSANLTTAKSKWTAVIANRVEVKNGAKVQLNSDYSGSNIPVPQGIWPSVQMAELTN